MCELIKIVLSSPSKIKFESNSQNSSLATGSNPFIGSSRIKIFALWDKEIAILNFAFIPFDNSLIFLEVSMLKLFKKPKNTFSSQLSNVLLKILFKELTFKLSGRQISSIVKPIFSFSTLDNS